MNKFANLKSTERLDQINVLPSCEHCGEKLISVAQFWCGEWEDLEVCPKCDIATDEDSGIVYLQ